MKRYFTLPSESELVQTMLKNQENGIEPKNVCLAYRQGKTCWIVSDCDEFSQGLEKNEDATERAAQEFVKFRFDESATYSLIGKANLVRHIDS